MYKNIIINYFIDKCLIFLCGGFLVDDMGFGKMLLFLVLVVMNWLGVILLFIVKVNLIVLDVLEFRFKKKWKVVVVDEVGFELGVIDYFFLVSGFRIIFIVCFLLVLLNWVM